MHLYPCHITSRSGHYLGRIVGPITLDRSPTPVTAGDPLFAPCPIEPRPVELYRFLLTSDCLIELGLRSGDELLIDHTPIGAWRDPDFDGWVVIMRSHWGHSIGMYHYGIEECWLELLDGSGWTVILTPDMHVIGVARQLVREESWGADGATFF